MMLILSRGASQRTLRSPCSTPSVCKWCIARATPRARLSTVRYWGRPVSRSSRRQLSMAARREP